MSFAIKTLLKVVAVPSTVAVIVPVPEFDEEEELFLQAGRRATAKIRARVAYLVIVRGFK